MSGERRALLIGTAAYPADPTLPDLRCPLNDVAGMAEILKDPVRGGFEDVKVLCDAPSSQVKRALEEFCIDARRDDTVLIYYSGHGKLDSAFELHLCTHDSETKVLASTSVPIAFVHNQLRRCRAENRVLMLDCCFSGAAKGVSARSAVDDTLKLSVKGVGTYLMTASDSVETAQEKEGDDYGVFTKHVLNGLRTGAADVTGRGMVTMDDLYEYVVQEIRADSPQRPFREFTGHGDIVVARSGRDNRRERAEVARRKFFQLAAEGNLAPDLAGEVVRILTLPPASLTPGQKQIEDAACDFLNDEATLGEFVNSYYTSLSAAAPPPPESAQQPPKQTPPPAPAANFSEPDGIRTVASGPIPDPAVVGIAVRSSRRPWINYLFPVIGLSLDFAVFASLDDAEAAEYWPIITTVIVLVNLFVNRREMSKPGLGMNTIVLAVCLLIFVAALAAN